METEGRSRLREYPGFTRGSERLTFEDLLSLCLRNTANSFTLLALSSEQFQAQGVGRGEAETAPSEDRFLGNLMILWAHIPNSWRTKELAAEYEGIGADNVGYWFTFYHNVLERIQEQGFLNPKVLRSLVE